MFITSIKLSYFLTDIEEAQRLIPVEINIIISISFIIDIILNLNTGFVEKGSVNLDR